MPRPLKSNGLLLTPELVARAHRAVVDNGPPADRVRMIDADYDALAEELLARAEPGEDIWLFASGSLIWNPACPSAEHRPAVVPGWHRSAPLRTPIPTGRSSSWSPTPPAAAPTRSPA